ncbi:PLP-dependent aminotransferase family protein [Fictibacillus aquaticus]|nr:PLP-dependent aminotransferase family protein [Fictibacillus aquaticus]
MIIPELKRTKPIYREIVSYFENRILKGELPPDTRLPTERELALQLNVNRSTVNTAYEELRASGLIQSVQGSGTRVSQHAWDLSPQRILNWNHFKNYSFSPTAPMVKRIEHARMNNGIYNLANGELSPDLYPASILNSVMQNLITEGAADYSHPLDDRYFRETLASHLLKHQIDADPNNMMLLSNIQQSLLLITRCLLNPGDIVAIECPSYSYTVKLFASAGVRMVRLPVDENGLDPDGVSALYAKHKIKLVITEPSHQNPTGSILSLERRKKLINVCSDLDIPIVEIDCTAPLMHDGDKVLPPSLYTLDQKKRLVINTGSFNDTVGPGLPVCWLLASPIFIERLTDAKYQMGLSVPNLVQQLASRFLAAHWDEHIERVNTVLRNRKKLLTESLNRHLSDLFSFQEPDGGLYVWVKMKGYWKDSDLLEACIKENLLVVPGSVYGAENGHVRIAFSNISEEQIEPAVESFARVVNNAKSLSQMITGLN